MHAVCNSTVGSRLETTYCTSRKVRTVVNHHTASGHLASVIPTILLHVYNSHVGHRYIRYLMMWAHCIHGAPELRSFTNTVNLRQQRMLFIQDS